MSSHFVQPEEYAIGIDFGTVCSSVAVWQQNGVRVFENEYGSRLTGSAVVFTDNCRLIGDTVHKGKVTLNPANTIANIKRLLGKCYSDQSGQDDNNLLPFRVTCGDNNRPMVLVPHNNEDKHFAPEEIAAMILSKMKEIADEHLNSKVSKAVITVPASFNDTQRKAIKDAGVIAGLDVLQLLNEPTATAIAYFMQNYSGQRSTEKTLLIFDLGGGNLDVSVVMIKDGTIRVQAVAGDTNLGGEDFDNNMVSYFVEKFMKEKKKDIRNKPRSIRRLRSACEKAKRVLSVSTNTQTVVEVDALDEGINFRSAITRNEFEELNDQLFKRSIHCVERCFEDAMIDKRSIDEVLLVGGSSRIPKMQQLLQDFFNGKELCKSINADEAVVYGAAVQAAIVSGYEEREKFNILELQDITSLSFGLVNNDGATMNLIIPKNTPIPARTELIFSTCSANQSRHWIEVQECESESATVFTLSGIPPKPKVKLNLSFEVDNSGILHLTATDITTTEKNEIVISKDNGGLTTDEIENMVQAAVHYQSNRNALVSLEKFACNIKAIGMDSRMPVVERKLLVEAADNTFAWLDRNRHAEITEIKRRHEELKTISQRVKKLQRGAIPFDHLLCSS